MEDADPDRGGSKSEINPVYKMKTGRKTQKICSGNSLKTCF